MAQSKCLSCDHGTFEFKENIPEGSAVRVYFVQCRGCGGVVGVYPFDHVPKLLLQQNKAIAAIAKHLQVRVDLTVT